MSGSLAALEGNILLLIQENLRNPLLNSILVPLTHLGDSGIFCVILTILFLIIPKTRRAGICCSLAMIFSYIITNLAIKNIAARIRPYEVIEGLTTLVGKQSDFSFPSGHASIFFAFSTALFLYLSDMMQNRKARYIGVIFLILAAVIAFSRMYVGVHFPTDVLVGTIIGVLCGHAGYRLSLHLFKKYPKLK